MSKWIQTLDLKDAWAKAESREITAQQMAEVVRDRLKALKSYSDIGMNDRVGYRDAYEYIESQRVALIEDFDDFSQGDVDFDDFDNLMSQLYDWGDIFIDGRIGGKKACWIATR